MADDKIVTIPQNMKQVQKYLMLIEPLGDANCMLAYTNRASNIMLNYYKSTRFTATEEVSKLSICCARQVKFLIQLS